MSRYTGYGDISAFGGKAPAQGKMYNRGLAYLKDPEEGFTDLDYITVRRTRQRRSAAATMMVVVLLRRGA